MVGATLGVGRSSVRVGEGMQSHEGILKEIKTQQQP